MKELGTDHLVFLVGGGGLFFSNSLKLELFSDKRKAFIFCNHKTYFTIVIMPNTHV